MPWFATLTDLDDPSDRARLARGRFGVVHAHAGRLAAIHLRPWPKLASLRELWPVGDRYHCRGPADHCWLYYNQPWRAPRYLALRYIVSTDGTSYATFLAAVHALDRVAAVKGSDALVCDAANARLSDRLLARLGWEAHAPMPWRRNFIRRFYGAYPTSP